MLAGPRMRRSEKERKKGEGNNCFALLDLTMTALKKKGKEKRERQKTKKKKKTEMRKEGEKVFGQFLFKSRFHFFSLSLLLWCINLGEKAFDFETLEILNMTSLHTTE